MRPAILSLHRIMLDSSFAIIEQSTMTLEQLALFVAVAERQHLTLGAQAAHRTPSAASAAIKVLETQYGVPLFHRVGSGIVLTTAGTAFFEEAKAILARTRAAQLALSQWRGVLRGTLDLQASQTVASYWLPMRLMAFHARFPQIEICLSVSNTESVARGRRRTRGTGLRRGRRARPGVGT